MRRITRGAAAVAAICAGALTMTSVATAFQGRGSGSDSTDYRVAGANRVQTSLEGLQDFSDQKVNVVIVGYQGVVDALSLAPLTKTIGETVVIYSGPEGLDARTIADLKAAKGNISEVMITGGPMAVPYTVEDQLTDLGFNRNNLIRFNGKNRFETAYITGAFVQNFEGMRTAAGNVAQREYLKRMLPKLQAAFEDAKAKHEAALADHLAKQNVYLDATAKYTAELAKVTSGKTAEDAVKDLNNAVASVRSASANLMSLKKLWGSPLMAIEAETKVIPQPKDASKGQVDYALQYVYEKATKAEAKKAIDDLVNLTGKLVADANKSGEKIGFDAITMTDTVGEAGAKLKKAIGDYQSVIDNANQIIASNQVSTFEALSNDAALKDPKSPVSVAAKAYLVAKTAFDASVITEGKTYDDMMTARHAYEAVLLKSVNDFDLAEYREVLAKELSQSYAKGDYNIFLATGLNFADALTAGPAAASMDKAVVLLSNGKNTPAYVMDAVKNTHRTVYGIGGPAAATYANAVPVVGKNRYETSVKVAREFFKSAKGQYALASGEVGADAVIAGTYLASANTYLASKNEPLTYKAILLTGKSSLPASVADFVQYGNHGQNQKPVTNFIVFGGEHAIERGVVTEADALTHN